MNQKPISLLSLLLLIFIGIQSASSSSAIIGFPDPGPDLPKIYIHSDGEIDPETAPIEHSGNTYRLTGNILLQTIIIQRSSIVLDGSGYSIEGNQSWMNLAIRLQDGGNNGIIITGQNNINITGFTIGHFTTGIRINNSETINIIGNTFVEGAVTLDTPKGIVFDDSSNILISDNNFAGVRGSAVTGNGSYISITGNTLTNIIEGIDGCISLEGNSNSIIGNKIESSSFIKLSNANMNVIKRNYLSGPGEGIFLFSECQDNLFAENNLTGHSTALRILTGKNNAFYANTFTDNAVAIDLSGWGATTSAVNMFYGNTFTVNSTKIRITGIEGTQWDNGTIGNYWANYNGQDSNGDGIGDTPYSIIGYKWSNEVKSDVSFTAGVDNYPLMQPYDVAGGSVAKPGSIFPLVFLGVCVAALLVFVGFLIYRIKRKPLRR